MKKFFFIALILVFNYGILYSQDDFSEHDVLYTTCKVWGFVKYYHPIIAKGKVDWDAELIKFMNQSTHFTSKKSLSDELIKVIEGYGKIKECKDCNTRDEGYVDFNFDLTWINDTTYITPELRSYLKTIEKNRFQGRHGILETTGPGIVKFKDYDAQENVEFSKKETRLLTLFDLWNRVEYFFPYKYLMDENWEEVLHLMIDKFREIDEKENFKLLLKEFMGKLDDSHAGIAFNDKKSKYVPFQFNLT